MKLLAFGHHFIALRHLFCLENPRDWGAWWAAVYGIAQSRTGLKRLSSSSSSRHLILVKFHSTQNFSFVAQVPIAAKLLCSYFMFFF